MTANPLKSDQATSFPVRPEGRISYDVAGLGPPGPPAQAGQDRERPWHDVVPPGPRDPDVVRAKALAGAGDPVGGTTARQSRSPRPAETTG